MHLELEDLQRANPPRLIAWRLSLQKRMLARYWDHVDDPTQISGSSRFLAGGLGGITSQFAIYPVSASRPGSSTNRTR